VRFFASLFDDLFSVRSSLLPAGTDLQILPYRDNYTCKEIPVEKNLQAVGSF
jgi:hypothetical protein